MSCSCFLGDGWHQKMWMTMMTLGNMLDDVMGMHECFFKVMADIGNHVIGHQRMTIMLGNKQGY